MCTKLYQEGSDIDGHHTVKLSHPAIVIDIITNDLTNEPNLH